MAIAKAMGVGKTVAGTGAVAMGKTVPGLCAIAVEMTVACAVFVAETVARCVAKPVAGACPIARAGAVAPAVPVFRDTSGDRTGRGAAIAGIGCSTGAIAMPGAGCLSISGQGTCAAYP